MLLLYLPILGGMSNFDSLNKAVQSLYDKPLEANELQEARCRLLSFYKILLEIDQDQKCVTNLGQTTKRGEI